MKMTKRCFFTLCLLLMLLLGLATAEAATKELRLPATAEEALKTMPNKLPPLPEVTVDKSRPGETDYIFSGNGLLDWPIRGAKRYQCGAFAGSDTGDDGLSPIKGRENEPFTIVVYDNSIYTGFPFVETETGRKTFTAIGIRTNGDDLEYHFSFANGSSYTLDSQGNVCDCSLYVDANNTLHAKYGLDGFITGYSYGHLLGRPQDETRTCDISLDFWADGILKGGYYKDDHYYGSFGWGKGEPPAGFDIDDYAVTLYPEEAVAQLEARRAAARAAIPLLPPPDGVFLEIPDLATQFPPLPVIEKEEDGAGNLRYIINGLEPWGFQTGRYYTYVDSGYDKYIDFYPSATVGVGKIVFDIPANYRKLWEEELLFPLESLIGERNYKGIFAGYSRFIYDDSLGRWIFNVIVGKDAGYKIALGDAPRLIKTAFLHIEGRIWSWASELLSGSASARIHSTSCVSHPAVGRASSRAF